jgi:hypothetical protein
MDQAWAVGCVWGFEGRAYASEREGIDYYNCLELAHHLQFCNAHFVLSLNVRACLKKEFHYVRIALEWGDVEHRSVMLRWKRRARDIKNRIDRRNKFLVSTWKIDWKWARPRGVFQGKIYWYTSNHTSQRYCIELLIVVHPSMQLIINVHSMLFIPISSLPWQRLLWCILALLLCRLTWLHVTNHTLLPP